MKKLALFVEGQTEQVFLESFLTELAGRKHIYIDSITVSKGTLAALQLRRPTADGPEVCYFVLLMNCQNDEKVKSVILDQHAKLTRAGYSLILGLRDLFPTPLQDLPMVKARLKYRVPTAGVPTYILLAVAEIEAWFLQEESHFARIDSRLDPAAFQASFGFDPAADSAETLAQPSAVLRAIYRSVGKGYSKTRAHVERTVSVLDYAHMYADLPARLPHFQEFVTHLDNFLA